MTEEEKDKLVAEAIVKNCPPNRWVDFVKSLLEKEQPGFPLVPTVLSKLDLKDEISSLQSDIRILVADMKDNSLIEITSSLIECIYNLIGLCLQYGFDPTPHMEEMQRSNMVGGDAPHIKEILIAQGWQE